MKTLWAWLVELDRILRGETTRLADLKDGKLRYPLFGVVIVLVLLAMLAGACTGFYALVNHARPIQMLASAVKVPALFLLTLLVTFPSLYVFNSLVGSRLSAGSLFRLFIAALAVNVAVMASLGPIVAFFAINTTSYAFMVLLNVVAYAVSGLLSLMFLVQTLRRLNWAMLAREPIVATVVAASQEGTEQSGNDEGSDQTTPDKPTRQPRDEQRGPLERLAEQSLGAPVRAVFTLWMIVFGLVGAQMSWVLRPLVGSPGMPFEWFRERDGNFFEAVWLAMQSLFG